MGAIDLGSIELVLTCCGEMRGLEMGIEEGECTFIMAFFTFELVINSARKRFSINSAFVFPEQRQAILDDLLDVPLTAPRRFRRACNVIDCVCVGRVDRLYFTVGGKSVIYWCGSLKFIWLFVYDCWKVVD